MAARAKVLHRDISIGNILMYPTFAKCANYRVMDGAPLLIDDVLAAEPRYAAVTRVLSISRLTYGIGLRNTVSHGVY